MENAWFHVTGNIPEAWRDRRIALRLNFGGETLVYDKSGVPLTGLTSSSVFFKRYVKEYLFLDSPLPDRIDLWCETVAMTLVGQAEGSGTGICSHLEIGWIDNELWNLKWEFQIVHELAGMTPGARSHRALMALDESITLFNGDPANASLAREPLKRILSLHGEVNGLHARSVIPIWMSAGSGRSANRSAKPHGHLPARSAIWKSIPGMFSELPRRSSMHSSKSMHRNFSGKSGRQLRKNAGKCKAACGLRLIAISVPENL